MVNLAIAPEPHPRPRSRALPPQPGIASSGPDALAAASRVVDKGVR